MSWTSKWAISDIQDVNNAVPFDYGEPIMCFYYSITNYSLTNRPLRYLKLVRIKAMTMKITTKL